MRKDWIEIEYKKVVNKISTNNKKLKQREYLQKGMFPVIDQGQELIGGYTNDKSRLLNCMLPAIVFGDHTKIVKIINFRFAPGADGTKVLEPKQIVLPKYLFFLTQILAFKIKDKGYARHYQHIEKQAFPLAPLPEQRAIVAKIEQLFSELDNAMANLEAAKEKLEIYRQAVLKKAFKGEGFTELKIEDVTEKVQIGPFGSQLHKKDYINGAIPLINPMHIQDGKIKPRRDFSISEEKRNQLPNYILENGDVIMGRRGEMGRCALVTKKEEGWLCGTGSLYLRPQKAKIFPPFLFYYIGSPIVKERLNGRATGTTMMNLNKKIIRNLPIPVPASLQEQAQIVREIETRLSVCDNVLADINEALEKSEALRQSILKKAFEGKLLSEKELEACRKVPDWEPAEQLLARIERSRNVKNKKSTVVKFTTNG